jgi:hypothetical protein
MATITVRSHTTSVRDADADAVARAACQSPTPLVGLRC